MIYKKLNSIQFSAAVITAVLISLIYFSLNFNYLSRFIDEKGDCLTYDYYVRLGIPQYLFNPHHIGFDWAGEQLYKIMHENGYTGTTMAALQLRNLIFSSLCIGIMFFLFYKISKRYLLSLGIVLMYTFCAAHWIYSQINDTPIIHSNMTFILFLAALYFPQARHKKAYAGLLGFWHALTIFFHQSDAIMALPVVFILMFYTLFPNEENKHSHFTFANIRYVAVYVIVFCIIVAVAYYYVGIVLIGLDFNKENAKAFNNIKDSSYFFNWLILYAKIDYWGKGFSSENTQALFGQMVNGISTYFYQPQTFQGKEIGFDFGNLFGAASILPNFIGILFIFVLGGSILFFIPLLRRYNHAVPATVLYMIIYSALTCWWEADYREFWVAPMFSFWFLTLIFFNFIMEKACVAKPFIHTTCYSFIFILAGLLFYFNFTGFILPYSGNKYQTYTITQDSYNCTPIPTYYK